VPWVDLWVALLAAQALEVEPVLEVEPAAVAPCPLSLGRNVSLFPPTSPCRWVRSTRAFLAAWAGRRVISACSALLSPMPPRRLPLAIAGSTRRNRPYRLRIGRLSTRLACSALCLPPLPPLTPSFSCIGSTA